MPPDGDLATAARLGGVSEIIADPSNLDAPAGSTCGCWCSAAANRASCTCRTTADVTDMEKIDPDVVDLPGWYRPKSGPGP